MHAEIMKDSSREHSDVLEKLSLAVGLLEESLDVRLIPPHGAKFAYAKAGAREPDGVAAVRGGIIDNQGKAHAAGPGAYGADADIARIVLTTMKFDPRMRSAATLRFSRNILPVLANLLLEYRSFDLSLEPPGITTMDWGVASCCKEGVPDVCYDCGRKGKEGLIYLFGEKPIDVVNNIIMISNRIITIEL